MSAPAGDTVPLHRAPTQCPVCTDSLVTLRLGCRTCGTEVSGLFSSCLYCRLSVEDLQMLEVFLRSRGNMRDVQAHLGVSYPTARQRYSALMGRLGLGGDDGTAQIAAEEQVLRDVAAGTMTVADAAEILGGTR